MFSNKHCSNEHHYIGRAGEWHGVKEAVDEFCLEHKLSIDHYENSKIISITLRGIGML